MSSESQEWYDRQSREFMEPQIYYFTKKEAMEFCGDPEFSAGFYCRLSAPGYLDCTDWEGPFKTEQEAIDTLYESYGDDVDL